jgi:hypothetical protein
VHWLEAVQGSQRQPNWGAHKLVLSPPPPENCVQTKSLGHDVAQFCAQILPFGVSRHTSKSHSLLLEQGQPGPPGQLATTSGLATSLESALSASLASLSLASAASVCEVSIVVSGCC